MATVWVANYTCSVRPRPANAAVRLPPSRLLCALMNPGSRVTTCLTFQSSPNCVDVEADIGVVVVNLPQREEMAESSRDTTQLIRLVCASMCGGERWGWSKRVQWCQIGKCFFFFSPLFESNSNRKQLQNPVLNMWHYSFECRTA